MKTFNIKGFFRGVAILVVFNVVIVLGLVAYIGIQIALGSKTQLTPTEITAITGSVSFIVLAKTLQVMYTFYELRRYQVPSVWYIGAVLVDLWLLPFLYATHSEQK